MSRDPREDSGLDDLARAWAEADDADAAFDAGRAAADPEQIWRAVAGEANEAQVRDLAVAAATDPQVSLAWRLARELGADETLRPFVTQVRDAPLRAHRRAWRAWPVAAALAAAVLVVVGLRLLTPPGPAPDSVWRDSDAAQVLVAEGEDGARRTRAAFALRWLGSANPATRYTVRVSTIDLVLVYEISDLEAAEVTVPEAALEPWPAGTTFYWQVEARAPDGRVASSPAVRVVLAD